MLEAMDQVEFLRQYREAEEKLSKDLKVSKQERILLLMGMLLDKETRKERKYGQT